MSRVAPRAVWSMGRLAFASQRPRIQTSAWKQLDPFHMARGSKQRRYPTLVPILAARTLSQGQPLLLDNDTSSDQSLLYQELQTIATQLRDHDRLYYDATTSASVSVSSMPIISDADYDALAAREAELCRDHPHLMQQWQRQSGWGMAATREGRVGLDVWPTTATTVRTKRRHATPMLSLDNVHSTPQLLAWLERVRKVLHATTAAPEWGGGSTNSTLCILTEPKLDGVSLNLRYELKETPPPRNDTHTIYTLQWASTRGDGTQGTDVTQAVHDMGSIPTTLSLLMEQTVDALEIRGEVVVPQSVFAQWQVDHAQASVAISEDDSDAPVAAIPRLFSNARNAASGILLRKDATDESASTVVDSRELRSKLRFYAYDIIYLETHATSGTHSTHGTYQMTHSPRAAAVDDSGVTKWTNRDVLEQLGFALPMPVRTTVLDVLETKGQAPLDDDDIDANTPVPFTEADISTMLQYHEALSSHRTVQPPASSGKRSSGKKTAPAASTTDWTWGDFDMDGCVHKLSDDVLRRILGNSNRAPRWAVAHKFAPTTVVTELWNVEVQVGRTGSLTPVAVLKPVDIGGVNVQRATMHNFPHMQQMLGGVDRIPRNSTVLVRRAGDVIPQVVSRVASHLQTVPGDNDDFISLSLPTQCPACGSPVEVETKADSTPEKSGSVGQVLRCGGPPLLCPPRAVAAMRHAYARDAFDVSGLSESRIQQLMEAGFLQVPSDIFAIAKNPVKLEEISSLDGWGTKSAQNVATVANRVATEGVSLSRFIYSLGIRLTGIRSSAQLAGLYGTVEAFLADIDEAALDTKPSNDTFSRLLEETEETKGIGPSMLEALREFSSQKALVDAAHRLAVNVKVTADSTLATTSREDADEGPPTESKPLLGMSVVFTGAIAKLSRAEAQKLAKQMGAKSTPTAVSKSTGMVVSGGRGGKKIEQAEKLGVRIVSTDEFLQLVESFRGATV